MTESALHLTRNIGIHASGVTRAPWHAVAFARNQRPAGRLGKQTDLLLIRNMDRARLSRLARAQMRGRDSVTLFPADRCCCRNNFRT